MAYSEKEKVKILKRITEHISQGNSLRSALLLDGMPSSRIFYEWIESDKEKLKQYTRATEDRQEKIFEEMLDIADDGSNDYMTITKGDNSYNVEDREVTNRSRLRIDTRKWMLSKMNPKKYSDRTNLDHTTDGEKIEPFDIGKVVKTFLGEGNDKTD